MIAGYAGALVLDEGKNDCRYAGYAGALVQLVLHSVQHYGYYSTFITVTQHMYACVALWPAAFIVCVCVRARGLTRYLISPLMVYTKHLKPATEHVPCAQSARHAWESGPQCTRSCPSPRRAHSWPQRARAWGA